jgi:hypothetical protein
VGIGVKKYGEKTERFDLEEMLCSTSLLLVLLDLTPGSSYSALQAPVTGERLKAFGNGPAQFGHEFYFFLYIWDLFKFVNV